MQHILPAFRHWPNRRPERQIGFDFRGQFPSVPFPLNSACSLIHLFLQEGADPFLTGSLLTRDTFGTIARSLKSKTRCFFLTGNLRVVAILPGVITLRNAPDVHGAFDTGGAVEVP